MRSGLYTLQIAYSSDPGKGAENLLFFYVPFGLAVCVAARGALDARTVARCLAAAAALAVLFAGVGFVEYYRKALFLNPKVVAANQYDNYFRVNSLFFDPSIYGRFLALVMIAVTTVVLWSREKRTQLWGAAILAWLLVGARDQLLAVEHRRAAAGLGDLGCIPLGRARHRLRVGRAGGRSPRCSCWWRRRACTSG